jgi:hypothetical protein
LPPDVFLAPPESPELLLTVEEVGETLADHFKANKSTGLSQMPLQCLKWLGAGSIEVLTEFFNVSAI